MPTRSHPILPTLAMALALWLSGSGPALGQQDGVAERAGARDEAGTRLEREWGTDAQERGEPAACAVFRPRFQALADLGSPRARLWLLEHWRAAHGLPEGAVLDEAALRAKRGLARDLVRENTAAPALLVQRLLPLLERDPDLPLAQVEDLTLRLARIQGSPELAAGALLTLARRTAPLACEDARALEAARAWLLDLRGRWPETLAAARAADELWRLDHFAVGRRLPAFAGRDVRGNELRSKGFTNRVVVLNVWRFDGAGWSARLREERHLNLRFWGQPFAWIGVNLDADPEEFRRTCQDRDIDWTQHAWEGGTQRPICEALRVGARPVLVLLDHEGVVRGIDLEPEELEHRIGTLLGDLREKIAPREPQPEDDARGDR